MLKGTFYDNIPSGLCVHVRLGRTVKSKNDRNKARALIQMEIQLNFPNIFSILIFNELYIVGRVFIFIKYLANVVATFFIPKALL